MPSLNAKCKDAAATFIVVSRNLFSQLGFHLQGFIVRRTNAARIRPISTDTVLQRSPVNYYEIGTQIARKSTSICILSSVKSLSNYRSSSLHASV